MAHTDLDTSVNRIGSALVRSSVVVNGDCMIGMKEFPDKWFDLAVVEPQYGIDRDGGETGKHWKWYEPKQWDKERPKPEYFKELFRISKNQIIFGANFFTEFIPPSMGWIFWDKGQDLTMSDGELAFSSFSRALRRIRMNRQRIGENGGNIHPTQKPVALYSWIYANYLPNGGKVIDTHGGSMSNVIAALKQGNIDITCFEIDKDYYNDAKKRIENYLAQGNLFQEKPKVEFRAAQELKEQKIKFI